jgi:hypothetical protein
MRIGAFAGHDNVRLLRDETPQALACQPFIIDD